MDAAVAALTAHHKSTGSASFLSAVAPSAPAPSDYSGQIIDVSMEDSTTGEVDALNQFEFDKEAAKQREHIAEVNARSAAKMDAAVAALTAHHKSTGSASFLSAVAPSAPEPSDYSGQIIDVSMEDSTTGEVDALKQFQFEKEAAKQREHIAEVNARSAAKMDAAVAALSAGRRLTIDQKAHS